MREVGSGTANAIVRAALLSALAAILVLAASIRLGPVLASPETRRGGLGPYGGPALYHALGLRLAEGKGFQRGGKPVVFRGPGYPLFLAAAYAGLGADRADSNAAWIRTWTGVRAVQSLMDASVCAAVAVIAWAALAGANAALRAAGAVLAALFQAINPYTAHWARTLLTEPVSGFLLAWCVAFLALGAARRRPAASAAGGIFAGALALTRPEYLPWAAAAFVLLLAAELLRRPRARRLARPIRFPLSALLVVAPWTWRNHLVFGKPVPVASGSAGELLHRGTFEGSHPWKGWAWCPPGILRGEAEEREMTRLYAAYIRAQSTAGAEVFAIDDAFMAKATARIRERPAECARAWLANIPRLWYRRPIRMFADPDPDGSLLLAWLVAAAAGLALGGFARLPALIAASVPAYLTLLYLPMHIESRYSTPATPLVAALAAYALARAAELVVGAASAARRMAASGASKSDQKENA